MRKTLLVTLEYPPQIGGVANYYANLVKNLPPDKITVLHLLPKFWPLYFFDIWKKIKEENIEVILVGQVLPLGTVVWLISKLKKIPYLVMTHAMDITYPQKYPRKKWLLKQILNSAERITTVSQYTRTQLQKLLTGRSLHKITIIPPGPNLTPDKFPSTEESKDQKIILSVSRLVQRKGHDQVLSALPQVIKKFPDVKYLITGTGDYQPKLEAIIKHLQLERNVTFLGKVSDSELAKLYRECSLFILPSRKLSNQDVEGFGLVFLEANSFGKPVIAGNSGGVPDAVVDGQTGFLVDPEDPDMIAKALIQLLYNPELAQRLGQHGQQRVNEKFTWPIQADRLKVLLK